MFNRVPVITQLDPVSFDNKKPRRRRYENGDAAWSALESTSLALEKIDIHESGYHSCRLIKLAALLSTYLQRVDDGKQSCNKVTGCRGAGQVLAVLLQRTTMRICSPQALLQ